MRVEEFDYDLPDDRIAQVPAARRDGARLMLVDRGADAVEEAPFARLPGFLLSGDLVVLNDTRVLPARLRGRKPGGGRVEILLLAPGPGGRAAMLSSSKGLRAGSRIDLGEGFEAEVLEEPAGGRTTLRFHAEAGDRGGRAAGEADGALAEAVARLGVMPLPPYIRRAAGDGRDALDRERYQTVYAAAPGAIAAPTAGLHFTPEMLDDLPRRGIEVARVTLHVGPGTFLPVRAAEVEDHVVEPEWFRLPEPAARAIAACRERGGRVVAVGTTATRVLEWRADEAGGRDGRDGVLPGEGWCDLTIRPGHRFRVVDVLLTNLHLPRSSLLVLVAAFAGRERILAAYREAVRRGFRFYSYGDAMLVR